MNLSRCVRRAFLCGVDDYSGKSYEHRRDWVESRLLELAAVFSIDLCAYAVMSNHLHLVLRVDLKTATEWTLEQVLQRWHLLYSGTLLSQRYLSVFSVVKHFLILNISPCNKPLKSIANV